MMAKSIRLAVAGALFIGSALLAVAQDRRETSSASGAGAQTNTQQVATAKSETNSAPASAGHSAAASPASRDAAHSSILAANAMRIEGEKRFRSNCGRCHMEPRKFPPRAMATIERHMRVRAMLTEEDMKLILNYMTE